MCVLLSLRVLVSACCSLLSSRKLWSVHMRCCGLLYSFRSVLTSCLWFPGCVVSGIVRIAVRSHAIEAMASVFAPLLLSQAMLLVACVCVLQSFCVQGHAEWSQGHADLEWSPGKFKQARTALPRQAAQLRVRTDNTRYSDFKFAGRHQARVRECWGRLVRRGFASGGNVSSQVIDDTRSRRDC